ncbi:MAG: hypothetical protein N3A69_00025 [Leptospiraceae bacterium]|nr:hypothetical protein [Leptospiraceae bacterium]
MRKLAIAASLVVVFFTMGVFLFLEHWRDLAPTPIPRSFKPIELGTKIDLENEWVDQSVYFHFTNPSCQCADTLRNKIINMFKKYYKQIQFVIVLEMEEDEDIEEEKRSWEKQLEALMGEIPIRFDTKGKLAKKLGVISTPQAAILNKEHELIYRGNYFNARYNIVNKRNFAEESLVNFLAGKEILNSKQRKAIGCVIPSYEETEK